MRVIFKRDDGLFAATRNGLGDFSGRREIEGFRAAS